MKTATEKYHAVLEGKLSEAEFIRQMRQAYPQYITQWNGYNDSVSILKQKQLIFEKKETKKDIDVLADQFPLNVIERGIDAELEAKGIDSTGNVSKEDYMKARVKVIANLQKDANHYINLVAGESAKVDKHDQMVEPKKGNEVDVHNGLKKADLKENYTKEKLLKKLGDADDARIQTGNGKEYIVYNPNSNNDDNAAMWHDDSVFAVDQDGGEHEIPYNKIGLVMLDETTNESNQEESIADYIIKYYSNPKTGKSLIDDEIIGDFFKTHPESRDQEPEDALDNFQEFLSVNYEMPGDYMQEKVANSVEDVIDPADYGMIGKGYLKGFNKPHSLDLDQLETLGRKVVDSLYKGDFDAAKAKFVDEVMNIDRKGNQKPDTGGSDATKYKAAARDVKQEAMSDAEMDAIKDYGKAPAQEKTYQLGDKFSSDFDYEGMLQAGLKVKISTPLAKMQQLYDSFEDVNYHSENGHLGNAIDYIEDGDKAGALKHLKLFRDAIRKTLGSFNEGASKVRKQLNERVGSLQEFIALIQDRAEENGTSEREEAEEVMYAIGDHYNIGVDVMKGPWDDDVNEDEEEYSDEDRLYNAWEEYKDGNITKEEWDEIRDMYDDDGEWSDADLNEGRRRKSQGGKVVTENDYDTGGYVESMGPIFDKAVNMLIKAWEEWKMGPMTEPGMIEFAKKDVLEYLETQLMVENLEEAKGKDHDGDGDVDKDDYMAAKDKAIKKAMGKDEAVKENIKAIIFKVLEEGVINEAATNALAEFSDTYGGYEGMKQAIIALQDIVTDIESYYDKTRSKIQKVYDTLGDIRNEEGLKVGGFLAPAIEQAFNKDLRPAVKGGFTKGLEQPKVRVLTQKDIDAHNSGERPLGEEEKQTVFSAPTINGAL